MPQHCMTCSLIVLNTNIGKQNFSNPTFRVTGNSLYVPDQNLPIYDFSMPISNPIVSYRPVPFVPLPGNSSYAGRFAPEGHEVSTMEEDDYPEIFALEDHERPAVEEDDDYPERFALSPVEKEHRRTNNRTIPVAVSSGNKVPLKPRRGRKLKIAMASLAEQTEKTTLRRFRRGPVDDKVREESSKRRKTRSSAPSPEKRGGSKMGHS
jgi:hypothetical protein